MYMPGHFEEPDVGRLHALIREFPFGALVTRGPDGLDANHIPFLVDPAPAPFGTLRAHVARNNPVWKQLQSDPQALVIFQGPDAYISPSAYPSKQVDGKVVPTWNYFVVHAHGKVIVHDDPAWVRGLVTELTASHEGQREAPWKVSDAPEDYVQAMVGAIVGLEMPIARLVGKRKASQNRAEADRWGVVEDLRRSGKDAAAALIDS